MIPSSIFPLQKQWFCLQRAVRFRCAVASLDKLKYNAEKTFSSSAERSLDKQFDIPKPQLDKMFSSCEKLHSIPADAINRTLKLLYSIQITQSEIVPLPQVLTLDENRIENRYLILKECGFKRITAKHLVNFPSIFNETVFFNKRFNFLPHDVKVCTNIYRATPFKLESIKNIKFEENLALRTIYSIAMKNYLCDRFNITDEKAAEIIEKNSSLLEMTLTTVERNVRKLNNSLKFPLDRIVNSRLLLARRRTLEILINHFRFEKSQLRDMISAKPQILSCSHGHISEILHIMRFYDFPTYTVQTCKKILTLHPDNFRKIIDSLMMCTKRKVELAKHPGTLKFVYRINNLLNREIEERQRNLIFSSKFIDFFLDGHVFRDNFVMLQILLCSRFRHVGSNEINETIKELPSAQWKRIPLTKINEKIDLLLAKGFSLEEIFNNLHIVFYSKENILSKLLKIKMGKLENLIGRRDQLNNSEVLRLVVYFIEQECGFSGEGIFLNVEQKFQNDDDFFELSALCDEFFKVVSKANTHFG